MQLFDYYHWARRNTADPQTHQSTAFLESRQCQSEADFQQVCFYNGEFSEYGVLVLDEVRLWTLQNWVVLFTRIA